MKHFSAALLSLALVSPAAAEDSDMREGMDLLSQGAELFLKGLMAEMEPALEEMGEALGNLNAYHAPEVLPNGDIIIRRKVPLQVETPEEEVDL